MLKKKTQYKVLTLISLVFLLALSLFLSSCATICRWCEDRRLDQGVKLLDGKGFQTDNIDIHDNLRVQVADLNPGERYTLRIVGADGRELAYSRLRAGRNGEIPAVTLLFAENLFPCTPFSVAQVAAMQPEADTAKILSLQEERVLQRVADWARTLRDRMYYLEVLEGKRIIRRAPFSINDHDKPKIYVASSGGCPQGGFIQRKDDIYVVGRNFPAGSAVRLFVVEDQRIWKKGDPFRDLTGINGTPKVEELQLAPDQRNFHVRIWSRDSVTTGLYDVIARYTDLERLEIDARDIIAADNDVGFVIQTDSSDPHIEQNMTVPASDGVLYYMFQDKYFNTNDVWIAVNPKDRPGGVSGAVQNARIYVVNHLNESQWVHGASLTDVGDGYDTVSIKGWCRNQNEIRIWEAPLTNGNYDVVVDFAPFGVYDQGQDIVDELDNVGLQVVNPSAFAIVYPVNDLRVFPGKEVPTGSKKGYIYAVAQIDPASAGTSIYWDSIDIDDPSSDVAPVDPTGNSGDDNRGNYGAAPGAPDGDDGALQGENASGIANTTTFSNGIAYVRFNLTMQPGDNFTVRGSTSSSFSSFEESAPITVWRKLHIEIDDMGLHQAIQ